MLDSLVSLWPCWRPHSSLQVFQFRPDLSREQDNPHVHNNHTYNKIVKEKRAGVWYKPLLPQWLPSLRVIGYSNDILFFHTTLVLYHPSALFLDNLMIIVDVVSVWIVLFMWQVKAEVKTQLLCFPLFLSWQHPASWRLGLPASSGLTISNNQVPLTTKEHSVQGMVPPH